MTSTQTKPERKMTLKGAQQELRGLGIVLRRDEIGADFVVYPKGAPERQHYYTGDLQDAYDTGVAMSTTQGGKS